MRQDLYDLTLHTFRAIKECPQGQQPGETFQATAAAGEVLIAAGCAERVSEEAPIKGYNRRDMKAKA